MTDNSKKHQPFDWVDDEKEAKREAYPLYAPKDDIYSQSVNMVNINPEDVSKKKAANTNEDLGKENELDFYEDETGDDLDVPGSELDDKDEKIGSEDEENNYYSIGGDEHNNLDEDEVE